MVKKDVELHTRDDNTYLTKEQYNQVYLYKRNHIRNIYKRLKKNPPQKVVENYLMVNESIKPDDDWDLLDEDFEMKDSSEYNYKLKHEFNLDTKPKHIKKWLN